MNKELSQLVYSKPFQHVFFGEKAREEMLAGAKIVAEAVGSTMGPSGHNVIIDSTTGAPLITKDGVTVAKSIFLRDKLKRIGAELVKEVASKTNELVGDGTTSSCVLAFNMFRDGVKMIATGRDAIQLKRGMDIASQRVIEKLKTIAAPIANEQEIINVGTISANGDREVGELISLAISKVGKDGIITIEPGKSLKTTLEVVEGMHFDNGYLSPYFVTNTEKNTVELDEPLILVTTKKLSNLADLFPVLEKVFDANCPLLIIADDVEGEALQTMIVNKFKNNFLSCAVKAPSYGENRTDILGDITSVVGGVVVDASSALAIKDLEIGHLGRAKKVIVGRNGTTIIGMTTEEQQRSTQERVGMLRKALESQTLDALHIDRYRKRLAKLGGGIALIKVGGSTEVEMFEKKDRVEDALNATLAAVQEGIVPGGGTALFHAQKLVSDELDTSSLTDDEKAGVQIVLSACVSPLKTIVTNTGKSADIVINTLVEYQKENQVSSKNEAARRKSFCYGYDAHNAVYGNLVEKGIIDPVKVTRYALEHSNSVVGLLLTCNSVVVNESENKNE